jgi:hypothetical protein
MTDKSELESNVAKQLGKILAKQMMKDYVRFCEKNEIPINRKDDVVMLDPKIFAQIPEDEHTNPFEAISESGLERAGDTAQEGDPAPVDISGDPVIDRVLTWVRDTFPGARMDGIQQPDIPDWLVEPLRRAEAKDAGTDCLILSGSHEFGVESYAGKVKLYRGCKDNVQVAIPNTMKWGAAVVNLRKLLDDLEYWIRLRTNTTVGELDMITEREVDNPFPPF